MVMNYYRTAYFRFLLHTFLACECCEKIRYYFQNLKKNRHVVRDEKIIYSYRNCVQIGRLIMDRQSAIKSMMGPTDRPVDGVDRPMDLCRPAGLPVPSMDRIF